MDDQNKVDSPKTVREIIIDFSDICRFCLNKTQNGISINDNCLYDESGESEGDSVYNFLTKLKFIQIEHPDTFPSHVCRHCFQLVQLCFDFKLVCQKSEGLLRHYHRYCISETNKTVKTEVKMLVKNKTIKRDSCTPSPVSNYSNAFDQINKFKKTNLQQKLKKSVRILDEYKKKLIPLSSSIKKISSQSMVESNKSLKQAASYEQLTYACSQCSLKFSNPGALNFHYVATHGQTRFRMLFKYQCQNCAKSFRDQENLKRHYKAIHKMQDIPEGFLNNRVKQGVSVTAGSGKFFCFHCVPYKEFQSQEELLQHLGDCHKNELSKNAPKLYACAYCNDLTFPTRVSVNEHLLLAHKLKEHEITWNDVKCVSQEQKVFVCMNTTRAPQYGTQLSSLLEVLSSIVDSLSVARGKDFKIACNSCHPPIEFTSGNDFAQHIRTCHDGTKLLENWASKTGTWTCSECPATYSRKQTLSHHVRDKHKQTLGGMKCPEQDCQESFLTNRQLIQHGISVHQKYFAYFHKVFKKILQPDTDDEGKREKNFECDVCQRKYIYKSSLRKHILTTHLGKSLSDSAVCPYCGKTISSKLNLKSHIEFVHEALFVSCPICKKKINFRTIGKHYKTHKTSSDVASSKNSFLCNLCGKILKSKRSFEDHQKLHRNVRDELCDICGSGFTNKKFLRLHKKTHEGAERKVFGCGQCDKVFNGRHTLNRHLLTHSGEKNFICEICSKCFYTLQELNRHVRYHKKEYRFDCQLCEMRFLDKSRFRHHMMKHRNVRPHKCHFCEKMFIVRGKMNSHMAAKHNFEVADTKGVWKDPKTYVPLDDLL